MNADFFCSSLLRTGLLLVACAVLAELLLRFSRCRNARIHRLAWCLVVLQGILWVQWPMSLAVLEPENAPSINEPQTTRNVSPISKDEPQAVLADVSQGLSPSSDGVPSAHGASYEEPSVRGAPFQPLTMCVGVWAVGIVAFLVFHGFMFIRLLLTLRKSVSPSEEYIEEWNALCPPRRIRLLVTDRIGPAVVCLPCGAAVLVPKSLWEESTKTIRLGILKHELSHVRHRDGLKSLLFSLLAVVQWFNPAAWWAMKRFNEAAEWRCDVEAYGNDEDALADFAESILLLHRTTPRYVGVLPAFRGRDLMERLRRLKEFQTQPREHAMKNVAILTVLVLLLCFGLFKINLVAKTPSEHDASASAPLIRGKVADAGAGIKVSLFGDNPEEDQTTLTDENGEFSLPKTKMTGHGNIYAVDAESKKIGYSYVFLNPKTGEIPPIKIQLQSANRVVTGTVVDAENRPAEGILVVGCYQTAHSEMVRTDKGGKFQFLYPEGRPLLRIVAFRKGVGLDILATEEVDPLQPKDETAVTPDDKIKNGPFHLKLSPIEPLKVRVVSQDGTPLAGATVLPWLIQKPCKLPKPDPVMWGSPYHKEQHGNNFNTSGLEKFRTKTDENGIAVIDTVPNNFLDDSTFSAHGPSGGVEQPDGTKRYYGHARVLWQEMETEDGLPTFTLPRQGSVLGTVKLEDGTPVSDVNIYVRWHNGSGGARQTDEKGEFRLQDNANVIYNLSFDSDKGAAPTVFNYSVGDGSEEKQLDIVLKPGIRLHGNVFMPDGSPAKDFNVLVAEKDPNPPASFQTKPDFTSPERRTGTFYTTDEGDKYLQFGRESFPNSEEKKKLGDGEYETFLPAVPREYRFRASKHPGKDNPKEITANVQDVRLLGNEKEFKLDFYLSEKGDNNCTPHANTPSTPTDEKPKPIQPGEQKPWVDTSADPKSANPMIPVDPIVKVLDPDGKPMKDVEIEVTFNGDDRGSFKVKTDENGIASVKELEKKKNTGYVGYAIKRSGYVFRLVEWQRGYGRWNNLPKEYTFTMEKAVEVGGIVVDEDSKPIQGATVDCQYDAPDRDAHLYPAGEAKTDAEGRWSVNMAPASMRKFRLDVIHPDFMRSEQTGTYPPYEQMRDRTAVVMLRKGSSLSGTVFDPDGKPVKDAKIVVTEKGREFSPTKPERTREDGTFSFKNWKPGPTNVYVAAVGYAPQMKECDDISQPVEFRLEPGKTVRFKVLDPDGKPMAKARVCPFRWRGTFLLLHDTKMLPQHADAEGNWSWTWAPDDEVEYSIIREGYQSIRDLKLRAQDEPYVYRMRLPLEIRGKVTDAETGETISNITLISGGNFDGKNPRQASYWNKDRPSKFTDGNYRAFFDEPRNGGGHHFMLEADGYEPFVSEMFTDDQGSLTLDVKLPRKK